MLLTTLHHGVQIVHQCCPRSRGCGVVPGMTLAHARALIVDEHCRVEDDDPADDLRSLHRLANWVLRWSPVVAPDPPDGLFINITGCQKVFRGEKRLLKRIARDLERLGFHARLASASTFGCAWAVARFGPQRITIVFKGGERESLNPLPIEALRLEPDVVEALHEVEVRSIGEMLAIPRRQLAERFGLPLLKRIDQALGTLPEPIEPIRPSDPPRAEQLFDGPTTQFEAIEQATRELVDALCDQLFKRESGARRIELDLERIDDHPLRTAIALSRPNRNPRHLWSLLRPRIETMNLGFGVERITLTASSIGTLRHEQLSGVTSGGDALGNETEQTSATGELIDTLAARLGADHLLRAELVEMHVPEMAFRWQGAAEPRSTRLAAPDQFTRPTHLLPNPEPISLHIPLIRSASCILRWRGIDRMIVSMRGPERIAPAWWIPPSVPDHTLSARDYFQLIDEYGLWLWAFRELHTGQWFIHGVWA